MNEKQSRTMREKDCNITPFIQSSPRLNDQTLSNDRARVLQRSRMTVREMFNWAVISDVTRGITNTTDSVGTESITMSPVMTEVALEPKTSGGRMSRRR